MQREVVGLRQPNLVPTEFKAKNALLSAKQVLRARSGCMMASGQAEKERD